MASICLEIVLKSLFFVLEGSRTSAWKILCASTLLCGEEGFCLLLHTYPHKGGLLMKLMSMADVVRRLGIPRHRITYALERQFLKEPQNLHGRRCFTENDLLKINTYFQRRPKP